MTIEIPRSIAEQIAERLDLSIREDYSGRSMYGATCLGFVGDELVLVEDDRNQNVHPLRRHFLREQFEYETGKKVLAIHTL